MMDVLNTCPVCRFRPAGVSGAGTGAATINCPRCGRFRIIGGAFDLPVQWINTGNDRGRFAASHAIRRMQAGENLPEIDANKLRSLWKEPVPNPQRQADLLLLKLGDAGLPLGFHVERRIEQFCGEVGTEDDNAKGQTGGISLILKRLEEKGLININQHAPAPNIGLRLTIDGWAAYESLRTKVVNSKVAFMAMSFSNPTLDKIVSDHFVPAVRETGFDLYRLDDRPKAGLIDNRMRVEIRTARFLVCDLTDENRGAYWEAGFAEGGGKPVFYTCEKRKFGEAKTHFDTEHMFTVLWEESAPEKAAEELKAAIRNEFPDAIPPDLGA